MLLQTRTLAWSLSLLAAATGFAPAQTAPTSGGVPRVVIPTSNRPTAPVRPVAPQSRFLYPWRMSVTATVFWIGETPTERNPVPNTKSSWDQTWVSNFGGFDDPDPSARIADLRSGEFRPKNFTPKLNPFYIALPYNDVQCAGAHRPEAARVIPWFSRLAPEPGKTVCKGRWLQIFFGGKSCYAQWEDVGPWTTDDWEYVFGNKPPRNRENKAAGIDVSPSIRDYLSLVSGQQVHWRFVEDSQVPYGPWKKYGQTMAGNDPSLEAEQKYLEYLRKLRDAEYQKKILSQS